jgi:hypothetical protein
MHVPAGVSIPCAAMMMVLAVGRPARASTRGCPVVLHPEGAEQPWQDAVRELRSWLRSQSRPDADCGGIEVRAEGRQTSIVFTTADGRRAERPVSNPAGLLAVVEALAVTIPETPAEPAPSLAIPPRSARDEGPRPARQEPASSEVAGARVLLGGSAGMRLLSPTPCSQSSSQTCTFGSLSLALGVGVNVRHWEFGVLGQYDPTQVALGGPAPAGFAMSTYALGLRAGLRDRVGPLDGVAGATTMISLTSETANDASGAQGGPPEQVEPRVGVFAGVVVPRRARVRMRPELSFEVIASHIGKSPVPPDPALPPLPWWSTSASIGIEWEAP